MINQRAVFQSGAIFNLLVGSGLILALPLLQPYLGMAVVPSDLKFLVDLVGMFICAFGVAYWLLAANFSRYRPLAVFGAVCKLCVVVIVVGHFMVGHIGVPLLALSMVDLLYAVLFILILRRNQPLGIP
jgi:hypothetical protein